MKLIPKPDADEFAPYAAMYNDLLPDDGRVLDHMRANLDEIKALVRGFSEAALITPCAEGEWTIKEILCHIIDDERIYAYRALRFARNDSIELPGFEQDDYVVESFANQREIIDIIAEYAAVRASTIALFESFDPSVYTRRGIASGHVMSVRAAAYHIAGHEVHHINSIRENYL